MQSNPDPPRRHGGAEPGLPRPPVRWLYEPPETLVLVVLAPVARADIHDVCERTRRLARHLGATRLACDLESVARPCAVLLDAVGRLQLIARGLGEPLELRRAQGLSGLIRLAGLAEVLPVRDGPWFAASSGVESGRETERRKQPLRVEEGVEPDDAVADDLDDL